MRRTIARLLVLHAVGYGTLVADDAAVSESEPGMAASETRSQRALAEDHVAHGRYHEAVACLEAALASCRAREVAGAARDVEELAEVLVELGRLYFNVLGRTADARRLLEEALDLRRAAYPEQDYPDGHPRIAATLRALSTVMHRHGEYQLAGDYARHALTMHRRLYPKEEYPHGHPELARSLGLMGFMVGGGKQGCGFYEEAVEIQRHFAAGRPEGRQELVATLNELGNALACLQEYARAADVLEEALEVNRRIYPPETHPQGHSDLVTNLLYLGRLAWMRSDLSGAEAHLKQALAMHRRLWPTEVYLREHPYSTLVAQELGHVQFMLGRYEESVETLREVARVREARAADFLAGAVSEAEAFSFAVHNLSISSVLLSAWPYTDREENDLYAHVWAQRGAVYRSMARRQQAVSESDDRETGELYWQYLATRRALSQLALSAAHPEGFAAVHEAAADLTVQKEQLERMLVERLPELAIRLGGPSHSYTKLVSVLPPEAVLLDFVRYVHWLPKTATGGTAIPFGTLRTQPRYAVFVISAARPVLRVEIEDSLAIDECVTRWRRQIVEGQAPSAAKQLRTLLWEPIERVIPPSTTTIYIVPDGPLSAVPWSVLPGERPDSILLERYRLALVPHGEMLLRPPATAGVAGRSPEGTAPETVLLVGDVDYDQVSGRSLPDTNDASLAIGDAPRWSPLPGTGEEVDDLAARAGDRHTICLRRGDVVVERILAELPKARWAHFATHGFFADARLRSALQPDTDAFEGGDFLAHGMRSRIAERNPLILSGLVLSGANSPRAAGSDPDGRPELGTITAEDIAAMPLHNLQLAVLSACETGLGEVAGGEGVLGLTRAFHLAGTRNVVASLWKVDDRATAALMKIFYQKLWQENLPPLEALRQAQLLIYRNPDLIDRVADAPGGALNLRAFDLARPEALPEGGLTPEPAATTAMRRWAAFLLSGPGNLQILRADGTSKVETDRPEATVEVLESEEPGKTRGATGGATGKPPDAPPPAVAPFDAGRAHRHQEAWADYLGVPVEMTNSIGMELVLIPPGEFMMGSTEEAISRAIEAARKIRGHDLDAPRIATEAPEHEVRITMAFYMGKHEVTQGQYDRVMGSNPSVFSGQGEGAARVGGVDTSRHPVERVSWADAMAFCRRLSALPEEHAARRVYRLPTEAQWEYACRAGTTTDWVGGDDAQALREYAWYDANSGGTTHPVGRWNPNGFGLFDMHGNVWEWCSDWWGHHWYKASPTDNPTGPQSGPSRVVRGGGFGDFAGLCRSANRSAYGAHYQSNRLGFRILLTSAGIGRSGDPRAQPVHDGDHGRSAEAGR